MSLLFHDQLGSPTKFAFRDTSEFDTVALGKRLWPKLRSAAKQSVHVYIRPLHKTCPVKLTSPRAIVCWADFDETIEYLAIPSKWRNTYPHIFLSEYENVSWSLSITLTEPVLLTEVIMTALSVHAYQAATSRDSALERWLCRENIIIRQGDTHTLGPNQLQKNGGSPASVSYTYRVDMVEPVVQGYARSDTTKFIVILTDEPDRVDLLPGNIPECDYDSIEIDEAFLASPPLSLVFGQHVHEYTPSTLAGGANSPPDVQPISFQALTLPEPIDPTADHCTLYVRTSDLGRIGILHGDWAMARTANTSCCRLVCLVANDRLIPALGTVAGSPILLHNLSLDTSSCNKTIFLHSSPFGSRRPSIPNARALTVARVASPFSVNRTYQPLCLKSLKSHFDSTRHLVKQGDIIAIPINTDDIAYRRVEDENNEIGMDGDTTGLPAFPSHPNEVVFFCITSVEHDIVKHELDPDVYLSSTIGELGCWVDSSITRIVQTGVEHSWVPDIGTYLGAVSSTSPRALYSALNKNESSHRLGPDSAYGKLLRLTSAASAQKAMDYKIHLSVLLQGARGVGKFTTASWVAHYFGMHLLEVNCYDIIGDTDTKTEAALRARFEKAKDCSPCVLLLRHIEALTQTTEALETGKDHTVALVIQECIENIQKDWKITGYPVIVFGTTSEASHVLPAVLNSFKHMITFETPGERERYEILITSLVDSVLAADVSLHSLATQTAALVASDLVDLIKRAKSASLERAIRSSGGLPIYINQGGLVLTAMDFEIALGKSRASYSESIGAPRIPNVSWDDVGGLAHVKADILDTIQLPLEHPELFADGLKKRSGVLLYGPPGTGKTLLAKAVATSCSLNFFSIKGPELLNMYIGESEANVRRVFQRARDAKPCVIFFDELDSVAPKRGNQGDSGGVMDRIVSQLLAELDGMADGKGGADVFVIGATNRPDLLDSALLRPGRFDRMLYLGVSETHAAQAKILEALTRKFRLAPDLDLQQLAEQCPLNYTGADFYALCSDAMLNAMSRKAKDVDEKIERFNNAQRPCDYPIPLTPQYFLAEMAAPGDLNVLVSREDFECALKDLIPSVSYSEMAHYAEVQRRFSQIQS